MRNNLLNKQLDEIELKLLNRNYNQSILVGSFGILLILISSYGYLVKGLGLFFSMLAMINMTAVKIKGRQIEKRNKNNTRK